MSAMRAGYCLVFLLLLIILLGVPASTAVFRSPDVTNPAARLAEFDAVPATCSHPVDTGWIAKVNSLKWVAYSSPNPDPGGRYYRPSADAIGRDLAVLRKAGFSGLITYASSGIMGKQFISIAQSLGYEGIIMGIWSPSGVDELANAVAASSNPIVLGYSIGNEGLGDTRSRYSVPDLCSAISDLRSKTGKPVATSEDIEVYYRWPELLAVGDWLFPISHPYWHFTKYAPDAVAWEEDQYAALRAQTERYIFFKEVGLPTAGAYGLSEANQDAYYRGLAQTDVRFAYFEGFDQPSKSSASVEPHWGIFNSDLTPKLLAWNMMGYRVFTGRGSTASIEKCGLGANASCHTYPAGPIVFVGDDRDGIRYNAWFSFNTSGLPDSVIVTAVKLKIKSGGVAGTDPLKRRRSLVIDVCTPPLNASGAHPGAAMMSPADCFRNAGTFADRPNSGWYTVDLDPDALHFINLKGASDFRVYIDSPEHTDSARSYIRFFSPDAAESDSPILLVKYSLP